MILLVKQTKRIILVLCSISDVYKDIVLNNDTMILFPAKNIYAQAIIFNTSFILSSSSFPSFIPHALKAQKFCKVKPIHRNHVFGMTVFYQFQITGNDKGLICHDEKVAYRPFLQYYTSFQSTSPFPISSSSMARAITLRLSALKGSAYCLAFICSVAASTPPLLLSFSSST